MKPQVIFTEALPHEAEACAELIYLSGIEMFEYPFGIPRRTNKDEGTSQGGQAQNAKANALAYIRHAFANGGGSLSYRLHSTVRLADMGGEIAGVASLYTGSQLWRLAIGEALSIARFYGSWRAKGVLARAVKLSEVISSPQPNEAYLANVAIAPTLREQGLGRALVGQVLAQAQLLGVSSIILDVAVSNKPALRLYEKIGFTRFGKEKFVFRDRRINIPNTQAMRLTL